MTKKKKPALAIVADTSPALNACSRMSVQRGPASTSGETPKETNKKPHSAEKSLDFLSLAFQS
jgi:hypothetical protein